ncbi:uncharacterized protein CANTADRAFT_26753 [Suhomyces tanzawaensis NRRL Y-17324]|uniref:Zn(2)-C6 fungal-type domain-containing protein n=1 Tax=Suhomyces tanzawaensis NRRL Y-17324 TaxID=984487 RepID=A0A1E4SH39_9ASCO|nr:uncharacterized protein CANTADRAFT_26753 [Suhomyces tanzawaensis NRRL Y-17324]ODV78824.1 hypothetical protein CANTADRAFT_26753 [Suhomyces tanzawaensis NRRL Y-17324]
MARDDSASATGPVASEPVLGAKTASSWTSGSSASSTPMSSPNMSNTSLAAKDDKSPKRRQRLGPSCDSCRSRKVKCNAVISIVAKAFDPHQPGQHPRQFSQTQIDQLVRGDPVREEGDSHVIVSNGKLIRFKSCKSCNVKGLACCFSKGFTKEDIMLNNKKSYGSSGGYTFAPSSGSSASSGSSSPVPALVQAAALPLHDSSDDAAAATKKKVHKVTKKKEELPTKRSIASLTSALSKTLQETHEGHTRKSSCVSCRKRKVKCVFNFELNKCEGCNKKSTECVFEKR